jgi:hypothetical protein
MIDGPSRGQDEKGHKKGHENVPFWVFDGFTKTSCKSFGKNGGDDETRTRDLFRDSGRRNLLELNGTDSPFLIL